MISRRRLILAAGAAAALPGGSWGRAAESGAPLHFRQATMVAPPEPVAWYNRWYVWTVVGVLAAGAAGTGIYFGTRSNDISVLFGGHR